jgi:3-oxoacyl-[acyl-carrier-protein] synthase II
MLASDAPIAITGIGVVAPTGVGRRAFCAALHEGRSAVVRGEGGHLLAPVGDFGARRYVAAAQLRRMPRLVQMTIVAAKQALADAAGQEAADGDAPLPDALRDPAAALGLPSDRVGAVLGTGLGTFDQTMDFLVGYLDGGPEAASPMLFPTSVMNAAAGLLALECGLRGVNSTINHKDASSLLALGMAIDQLRIGRADALLVGALDELCDPVLEGYRLMGGLATEPMRPYDRARTGLALGESAAVLVLERLDDALRLKRRVRAVLRHRAETSESRPRIGWGDGRAGVESVRAVREALARAPGIGWIAGGGNGTRLDELEIEALDRGFTQAERALPPLSSVLSQTGESAASAMLRVCAAVEACERGTIFGTLGLEAPLGWRGELPRQATPASIGAVLVPSFGQGGSNAALIVERAS